MQIVQPSAVLLNCVRALLKSGSARGIRPAERFTRSFGDRRPGYLPRSVRGNRFVMLI